MMYVIAIYTQELKPEDVINMVEKLTSSYYDALSFILTAISIILAFAVWDRSTMKKAIQKEFEAKLEKETEKVKQETEIAVDEIIDNTQLDVYREMYSQLEQTNKEVKTILEQETNKVKQEMQTKIDDLFKNLQRQNDKTEKLVMQNTHQYTKVILTDPSVNNFEKLALVKQNVLALWDKVETNDLTFLTKYFSWYQSALDKEVKLLHDKLSAPVNEDDLEHIQQINVALNFINGWKKQYPELVRQKDLTLIDPSKIEQNANED